MLCVLSKHVLLSPNIVIGPASCSTSACLIIQRHFVLPKDFLGSFCNHCLPLCVSLSPPFSSSPDAKHRTETELGPQTRPRSHTLPKSFGSMLDQGSYNAAAEVKGPHPTKEETLELIQRRVKGKRQEDGWPDDIKVRVS